MHVVVLVKVRVRGQGMHSMRDVPTRIEEQRCVYLSEELFHQTVSPAVMQRPGFGWMTDVCSVKHQRQDLHFVYTGEEESSNNLI